MKKNIVKSTVRNAIDGILVFLLFITTTVYALPSNGVTYDNSNSGSSATTVNEALDDLYTKVNDKQSEIDRINGIGDASASHILSGKTAYVKGQTITGTIPSKGAATYTPGTSNQTIAAGNYLSGAQTIKGDANLVAGNIAKGKTIFGVAGSYTSDANAAAGHILSGKTAYVNGTKITGSLANRAGGFIWTDSNISEYTYSDGKKTDMVAVGLRSDQPDTAYINKGTKFIVGTKNDIAAITKSGTSFLGVAGTYTSDANAAAGHILSGKTAYVNGSKITGTIPSKGAATYTPGKTNQTIAAGNYLSGAQTIKGDANLVASNIISGKSIFGVSGSHTAKNHSYSIFYYGIDNHANANSATSFSYTADATGKVVVFSSATASGGNLSGYWSYGVTKNGTAVSKNNGSAGAWNGTATYQFDVAKGDVIVGNSSVSGSSGVNSVSLFGVFVK